MAKPATPQEMFDLWSKMVNPGAFPLQSLMFPVLDPKELEKKIAELEAVEHWLKANLGMVQMSIKSLDYQRALMKGGEKAQAAMQAEGGADPAEIPNPALWAWNLMQDAQKAATAPAPVPSPKPAPKPKKKPTSRRA